MAATGVAGPASAGAAFGIVRAEIRGFRTVRHVVLAPGALCALVGEARAGKSNLLAALHAALDPELARPQTKDLAGGHAGLSIRVELASGAALGLDGLPPDDLRVTGADGPPALFLPAAARATSLVAGPAPEAPVAARALEIFRDALDDQMGSGLSTTAPGLSLVAGFERCCTFGVRGTVLLIEEPELYLRPQAQRYLYRLLREFAAGGNQVIYSTHSPAFLNVGRLDELVLVERPSETGTRTLRPEPVTVDEDFRVLTEFDAERSELFLARAAVLVEGQTEKLAFPFVFAAVGRDADREGISIVECGGKANIPLFARICRSVGVPFVAVYDRDARCDPLNEVIASVASERAIVLDPDFEAVAGLRGRKHKPKHAWRHFASLPAADMPDPLVRAVKLAFAAVGDPV